MSLAEPLYLVFLAVAVLGVRLVGNRAPRALVLVPLSLVFYATWNPLALLPLLATAAVDFNVARALGADGSPGASACARRARASSSTSALLSAFKYSGLLARAAAPLLGRAERRRRGRRSRSSSPRGSPSTRSSRSAASSTSTGATRSRRRASSTTSRSSPSSRRSSRDRSPAPRRSSRRRPARSRRSSDEDGSRALFRIGLGLAKKCLIADVLAVNLVNRVFEVPGLFTLDGGGRRGLRLRGPDLGGLLGLQRHRHRLGTPPRLPAQGELRLPLPGRRPRGVLEALAHLALHVAARLPLLLAPGKRPRGSGALREPRRHVRPRRALARDDLGLRGLGPHPRSRPRAPAAPRVAAAARGGGPLPAWRRALGVFVTFHVVSFAWILFRCESGAAAPRVPPGPRRRDVGARERSGRRRGGPRRRPRRPLPPVVVERARPNAASPFSPPPAQAGLLLAALAAIRLSAGACRRPVRLLPVLRGGGRGEEAPEDGGHGAPRRARRARAVPPARAWSGSGSSRPADLARPAGAFRGEPRAPLVKRNEPLLAAAVDSRPTSLPGVDAGPAPPCPRRRGEIPSGAPPAVPIEDPSGELGRFFERLARVEAGEPGALVRITHFGDSPLTGDLISGEARELLQAELGDGGPGFVLAARPWGWYGHQGIRIDATGWTASSPLLAPGNGGHHGLGLVSFTSASASARSEIRRGEGDVHPGGGDLHRGARRRARSSSRSTAAPEEEVPTAAPERRTGQLRRPRHPAARRASSSGRRATAR